MRRFTPLLALALPLLLSSLLHAGDEPAPADRKGELAVTFVRLAQQTVGKHEYRVLRVALPDSQDLVSLLIPKETVDGELKDVGELVEFAAKLNPGDRFIARFVREEGQMFLTQVRLLDDSADAPGDPKVEADSKPKESAAQPAAPSADGESDLQQIERRIDELEKELTDLRTQRDKLKASDPKARADAENDKADGNKADADDPKVEIDRPKRGVVLGRFDSFTKKTIDDTQYVVVNITPNGAREAISLIVPKEKNEDGKLVTPADLAQILETMRRGLYVRGVWEREEANLWLVSIRAADERWETEGRHWPR